MMWPFRKKPAPDAPIPPTSWKAGDMAANATGAPDGIWCNSPEKQEVAGPKAGEILRVVGVNYGRNTYSGRLGWALFFAEFPGESFFAVYFRKIIQTHTAADAEFTEQIKRGRERVG